jgi:ribose 5-phosphate isomerase B
MAGKMIMSIAADHGGFALKEAVRAYLTRKGYDVLDFGTADDDPCDYPPLGYKAAKAVAANKAEFGVVICKTGFGMAIVANKVKGVRCAVCDSADEAVSARQHNHCNVLSLAALRVTRQTAEKIIEAFINTKPEAGRHKRRVRQIKNLEKRS